MLFGIGCVRSLLSVAIPLFSLFCFFFLLFCLFLHLYLSLSLSLPFTSHHSHPFQKGDGSLCVRVCVRACVHIDTVCESRQTGGGHLITLALICPGNIEMSLKGLARVRFWVRPSFIWFDPDSGSPFLILSDNGN